MKYILAKLIGHKEVRDLKPEECIFCQIANGHHPAAGTILYEDETLVCFPDYRPCGVVHLQIVPKRHILNVDSLQPGNQQHLDLATSMLGLGQRMVEAQSPGALASGRAKFGYHLEPFHSVLHLHMHAFVLPHKLFQGWLGLKYSPWTPWWMPAETLLKKLQDT